MVETTPTPLPAGMTGQPRRVDKLPNTYLDELVEQGGDELRLSMLLIEVSSCNDQALWSDFALINRAYHFAKEHHKGQIRKSGEPFLAHCVEVARLLAQLGLDHTTVAAGLLHDVIEDTPATDAEVAEQFGDKIAELIAGVTKIDQITYESREARQAETYRKMLLSMVKDIRVILIKLADRLHNMRTLQYLSLESRERTASETLEVYAPLAHRFGLARIRWQLEDQSLKFLEPETYQELRESVAMTRREREDYIKEFKVPIEESLHANGIKAEFTSRAKNFYSIYNKMKARGRPFDEIYDLLAMRIITGTVRECYQILGWVHHIYTPIPGRIKDYISTPKSNMYQSLHTSVIGPKGQYVEVQIRTAQMHHTAEIGIAAHWRYKSNDTGPSDLDQHMSWLHQVMDWQQEATDPVEFMESLKTELASPDEIFVFTPKGDLHQLPKGATPIDFAFAIHTDIGLHCTTAKVNDQIVPLSATLNSGETVEIITTQQQKPRLTWLDQVKTAKARQAIRHWLREEQYDHNVRLGKEALDRELKRYRAANPPDLDGRGCGVRIRRCRAPLRGPWQRGPVHRQGHQQNSPAQAQAARAPAPRPQRHPHPRHAKPDDLLWQVLWSHPGRRDCRPSHPRSRRHGPPYQLPQHRPDFRRARPLARGRVENGGRTGLYRSAAHSRLGPHVLARGHRGGDQRRWLQHPRLHYPHRWPHRRTGLLDRRRRQRAIAPGHRPNRAH